MLKYEKLASEDIRFNVPLAEACYDDRWGFGGGFGGVFGGLAGWREGLFQMGRR